MPAVRSAPYLHPSLPAAGFMSSPGLSSISVTHRPHYWGCSQTGWAADGKGLQDIYGFCRPDKDLRVRPQKYVVIWVWTRQCFQHVCQKKKKNTREPSVRIFLWWECLCWPELRGVLELVWSMQNLRQWI